MASRTNLVNLDAMIKRSDFAEKAEQNIVYDNASSISIRDFTKGGLLGPSLRKPDFQRETNHWTPEQVVSLLECFVNGDLIPSVILWKSSTHIFVIDGGHRLSVLRAWVEDDFGAGPTSQAYYGYEISDEQKKINDKTRLLVNKRVGSYQHYHQMLDDENLPSGDRAKLNAVISRSLNVQWVNGDADKAESSFFQINTKGTPLDSIEDLLLRNRRKPIPIVARAVIRAGKGNKYWSRFEGGIAEKIESSASHLHSTLFDPEVTHPIKTLDLPLGGSKGIRTALQALLDFSLIAARNQNGLPLKISDMEDDVDGSATLAVMSSTVKLAKRITGNDGGSLGLHPAVYFYGPSGRHSSAMFMGTVQAIGKVLSNNNKDFFKKLTAVRSKLEAILIEKKDLIATILQKHISHNRIDVYEKIFTKLVLELYEGLIVDDSKLVEYSGLIGKVFVGNPVVRPVSFSDDSKSGIFIKAALSSAMKCPLCGGYIDPNKSMSYDHVERVRDGGKGGSENGQLTHPYCNQSVKC